MENWLEWAIEILIEYMTLFERRIYIRSGTNNYNAKRYSA